MITTTTTIVITTTAAAAPHLLKPYAGVCCSPQVSASEALPTLHQCMMMYCLYWLATACTACSQLSTLVCTALQEVRFQFSAASVGNATLRFSATVGGATAAVADSVQLVIPVLGVQSDVWVATSFAIRPNASNGAVASRQEGLLLPKAVNGSGSLDLVAGVGYLPAVKVRGATCRV